MPGEKLLMMLGAIAVLIVGCRQQVEHQPLSEDATEVIENFTLTQYQMAEKQWELNSPRATIYRDAAVAWLENLRAIFYRKGKISATLLAEKGKINLENNNLQTIGKTQVNTDDGQQLFTRDIVCESATGKIFTREYVLIKSSNQVLSGQGLETDTTLEKIVIYNEKIISTTR